MNFIVFRKIILVALVSVSFLLHADTLWIDVRSSLERSIDKIEGDVHILHEEIVQEVNRMFPDRSTEIRLYCRSGRRAGIAMSALKEAGYTNVLNIGSIENARKERGLSH